MVENGRTNQPPAKWYAVLWLGIAAVVLGLPLGRHADRVTLSAAMKPPCMAAIQRVSAEGQSCHRFIPATRLLVQSLVWRR